MNDDRTGRGVTRGTRVYQVECIEINVQNDDHNIHKMRYRYKITQDAQKAADRAHKHEGLRASEMMAAPVLAFALV